MMSVDGVLKRKIRSLVSQFNQSEAVVWKAVRVGDNLWRRSWRATLLYMYLLLILQSIYLTTIITTVYSGVMVDLCYSIQATSVV